MAYMTGIGVIWPEVWHIDRCQIHGWDGSNGTSDWWTWEACPDCTAEFEQLGDRIGDQYAAEDAAEARAQFRVVR